MYRKLTTISLIIVFLASVAFTAYNYAPRTITAGCQAKASCCSCEKCACDNCSCAKGSCCSEECCKCGKDCKCEKCSCKEGACKVKS